MNIFLFEHTDKGQQVSKKVDLIKMKSLFFSHKKPVIIYSFKNLLKSNFHKMNVEIMYRCLVAIRFLQQPPYIICRHFFEPSVSSALAPVSLRITHRTRDKRSFYRPFFLAPW